MKTLFRVVFTCGVLALALGTGRAAAAAWTARYDGGGTDRGLALAVTDSSHVYVAGASQGAGTGYDIQVIRYGANGAAVWTYRYNGPVSGDDVPAAIAADALGNTFVTGSSAGSGASDCVVLKFAPNGSLAWAYRYAGAAGAEDYGRALVPTGDGGVVVAGATWETVGKLNRLLIKLNSAGTPAWIRHDDGAAHKDDETEAVLLLAGGAVATTSIMADTAGYGDIVTAAFDAAGNPMWSGTYDGPGHKDDWPLAMTQDAAGNLFVTGLSVGASLSSDCVTLRYAPGGALSWSARLDGGGNDFDTGVAVLPDGSGGAYVGGLSYLNTYHFNYFLAHYLGTGSLDWNHTRDASLDLDEPTSMTRDVLGRVILTGTGTFPATAGDYWTVAYTTTGTPAAMWLYSGPGGGVDNAAAVASDGQGSLYVTGASTGVSSGLDFATVRFDNASAVTDVPSAPGLPLVFALRMKSSNPVRALLSLEFAMPSRGTLDLDVHDAQGRLVLHHGGRVIPVGFQPFQIDLSPLPQGVYFLRIHGMVGSRAVNETRKVVVLR